MIIGIEDGREGFELVYMDEEKQNDKTILFQSTSHALVRNRFMQTVGNFAGSKFFKLIKLNNVEPNIYAVYETKMDKVYG